MNISSEKIKLAQYILNVESEEMISRIKYFILAQSQSDPWDELPDKVKADVEESIQQLNRGEKISNAKVMKEYKKWLKK